jgi:hypothetical protein
MCAYGQAEETVAVNMAFGRHSASNLITKSDVPHILVTSFSKSITVIRENAVSIGLFNQIRGHSTGTVNFVP